MYGHGTVWVWTYALDGSLVFVWETRGDLKEGQGRFRGRKKGLGAWDTGGSRGMGVGGPGGSISDQGALTLGSLHSTAPGLFPPLECGTGGIPGRARPCGRHEGRPCGGL